MFIDAIVSRQSSARLGECFSLKSLQAHGPPSGGRRVFLRRFYKHGTPTECLHQMRWWNSESQAVLTITLTEDSDD